MIARRFFSYLIDLLILAIVSSFFFPIHLLLDLVTLGIWYKLPIGGMVYAALFIASPCRATLGMMAMGIAARAQGGGPIGFLQALLWSGLYYVSMSMTGGLVLLIGLFTDGLRLLHDYLAGIKLVVVG